MKTPDDIKKPWMKPKELAILMDLLTPRTTVVEWGSGGSTFFLSPRVSFITSIEHNLDWANVVESALSQIKSDNVRLVIMPQNPDRGTIINGPYNQPYRDSFRAYVKAGVDEIVKMNENNENAVIIDGRCRLDCAVEGWKAAPRGTLFFFHDFFNPNRRRYLPMLVGRQLVAAAFDGQSLAVFKK